MHPLQQLASRAEGVQQQQQASPHQGTQHFDISSECSTTDDNVADTLYCPDTGQALNKFHDKLTDRIWLHNPAWDQWAGWMDEHPDYVAPAIGISQAEADALFAAEVARRNLAEAEVLRGKAQDAEMAATAAALEAAEKAALNQAAAEAAFNAASEQAAASADAYGTARDLANADAAHRRNRLAIADGSAPLPGSSAPPMADIAQALSPAINPVINGTADYTGYAPVIALPAPADLMALYPTARQSSLADSINHVMSCFTPFGVTARRRKKRSTRDGHAPEGQKSSSSSSWE